MKVEVWCQDGGTPGAIIQAHKRGQDLRARQIWRGKLSCIPSTGDQITLTNDDESFEAHGDVVKVDYVLHCDLVYIEVGFIPKEDCRG